MLPRTVDLGSDLMVFLTMGLMFGVMGALLVLLPPWRFDPATEGWQPYLFLGAISAALWSVPLLLLRRVLRTVDLRLLGTHYRIRRLTRLYSG